MKKIKEVKNLTEFKKLLSDKSFKGRVRINNRIVQILVDRIEEISRTASMFRKRRDRGLCIKCNKKSDINKVTKKIYSRCKSCRKKENMNRRDN